MRGASRTEVGRKDSKTSQLLCCVEKAMTGRKANSTSRCEVRLTQTRKNNISLFTQGKRQEWVLTNEANGCFFSNHTAVRYSKSNPWLWRSGFFVLEFTWLYEARRAKFFVYMTTKFQEDREEDGGSEIKEQRDEQGREMRKMPNSEVRGYGGGDRDDTEERQKERKGELNQSTRNLY